MQIPLPKDAKDFVGTKITLRRIRPDDLDPFWQAAGEHPLEIFRWYAHPIGSKEEMQAWLERAMEEEQAGVSIAYATVLNGTGAVIGSTRFMTIERDNRSLEIGNTWLAPAFQRTAANTEAKYLMMRTAFEDWECRRVGLKTDSRNERSKAAILRIGAKEEGTLRHHMVRFDGGRRDSIFFSVIVEEWPEVKANLERRLSSGPPASL